MFRIGKARSNRVSGATRKRVPLFRPSTQGSGGTFLAGTQAYHYWQSEIRLCFANASFEIATICFIRQARIIYEEDKFRWLEGRAPASPFQHLDWMRPVWRRWSSGLHYRILFAAPCLHCIK